MSVERVNGVPVMFAAGTGAVQGGIAFRVGAADERLPERGLTHLIEHLALLGFTGPTQHRNGFTGSTITTFIATGSEQVVVDFLNHIARALSDLPLHQLESERAILKVEAQGRSATHDSSLLGVRYGATGLGRLSYREFGAEVATADEVAAWSKRWFVRGNAVAWITSGGIPQGLDLSLPEGDRRPYLDSPSLTEQRPGWFAGPEGRALVDAVVERSTAAILFAEILSRALFRRLRTEGGFSYSVGAQYEPLDAERARILVTADSAPAATGAMVGALAAVLADFRDGILDPVDVDAAREHRREVHERPVVATEVIGGAAHLYLLGTEPWDYASLRARQDAVTDDELAAVGRAFWADAIWQTPAAPDGAGDVMAISPSSESVVDGLTYFHATTRERVVLGAAGVSVVQADGAVTVLYDECEAALQWGDGGRLLIGRDSTWVSIEPSALRLFGEAQLAAIDAAVPAESVIALPARPADQIPQVPPPPPIPSTTPGLGVWALVISVVLVLLATPFLVYSIGRLQTVGQVDRFGDLVTPASAQVPLLAGAMLLVASALLVVGWVRRVRWVRRHRR